LNVERLHAIAQAVRADLNATAALNGVRALRDALTQQLSAPSDPAPQQALSEAFQRLSVALTDAPSNRFSPAWRQVLDELDISPLLGRDLLDRVQATLQRNQITVAIAAQDMEALTGELDELTTDLDQLLTGLSAFNIGAEALAPGSAEVSVLVPRAEVDNALSPLGRELVTLEGLLLPFVELATGSRAPLPVTAVSSSDFGVYLTMVPAAALMLSTALDKILDTYKKVLEIRALREQLERQAVLSAAALAPVDEEVNQYMSDANRRFADELIAGKHADLPETRLNELRNDLRRSLDEIADRIDHGYNIDVRASADPAPGDAIPADVEALQLIVSISPRLKFINATGRPILRLAERAQQNPEPPGDEAAAPAE